MPLPLQGFGNRASIGRIRTPMRRRAQALPLPHSQARTSPSWVRKASGKPIEQQGGTQRDAQFASMTSVPRDAAVISACIESDQWMSPHPCRTPCPCLTDVPPTMPASRRGSSPRSAPASGVLHLISPPVRSRSVRPIRRRSTTHQSSACELKISPPGRPAGGSCRIYLRLRARSLNLGPHRAATTSESRAAIARLLDTG